MTAVMCLTALMLAADPAEAEDPHCGSHCLYVALRALDIPLTSFEELESKLGPPTAQGYSLGKIEEVARSYGLQTLGVQTSFENLKLRDGRFACIAHLENPPHFVNIADADDAGQVFVIDPPRTYTVPADTLRLRWKGTALLLSAGPLAPEEALRPPWGWRQWLLAIGLPALLIAALLALRRSRRAT